MKQILGVFLLANLAVYADGRAASIATVERFLKAASAGDGVKALEEFAQEERGSAAVQAGVKAFVAETPRFAGVRGINRKETGNAAASKDGVAVTYLFGELDYPEGMRGFLADLVEEQGAWKLVRFSFKAGGEVGSQRVSYSAIPAVNNNVQSMAVSRGVLDRFLLAGEKRDVDAALQCWVKGEREKQRPVIERWFTNYPQLFANFRAVDEGRSDFGFENGANAETTEVRVNGTMRYADGKTRRLRAKLRLEDGELGIAELTLPDAR